MASSKKTNPDIDLLVRVGILEAMLDKLQARVDTLERIIFKHGIRLDAMTANPQILREQDEWEIDNANGEVKKKEVKQDDDVDSLLS